MRHRANRVRALEVEIIGVGIVLADAVAEGIEVEADRPVDKAWLKREVFRFPA